MTREASSGSGVIHLILTAMGLTLLLIGLSFFCGWVFLQRMARLYDGHIYPNVYALGVDLGGKTPQAAADALDGVAQQIDVGLLVVTDGERRWSFPWSLAGLRVDPMGTAQAAYQVGRDGTLRDLAQVWLYYHDVAPRFLFDTAAATQLLHELDTEVSQPMVAPTIELQGGEITLIPGQPGHMLDIPTTLARLREASGSPYRVEVPLAFRSVQPPALDVSDLKAQAEALLARQITIRTYDVLTDETFSWGFGRDEIAQWLHLIPGPDGQQVVDLNLYAIRDTLTVLAADMGEGRGFRYEEAAQQIYQAIKAGESELWLYLTHAERRYIVQPGDTIIRIGDKFGMPPGLIVEANPGIDADKLYVGQEIRIPSQDVLTPYMPVIGKKIVVSLEEQRVRVYEHGQLIYDWPVSTGLPDSPTQRGVFQVLDKHEKAYASQWDLWMPYFITVYSAGGGVENGFHELPILANGQRLWEGALGHPASFGCIILGIPAAQTLYEWAEIGTVVVIQ